MMSLDSLLQGIDELLRDFDRLFSADVAGYVETERTANLSRRPVKRPRLELGEINRRAKLNQASHTGFANGLELQDRMPNTFEEWQNAPLFYIPFSGEPVVNSVGESLVLESGWTSDHCFEFSGTNASRAVETIRRANDWAFGHWGQLTALLYPRRATIANQFVWPDVVLRVAELANIKTLKAPEWMVNVGDASWSVEMWKRREEFTLGTPNYSQADFERIGDEPEEYFTIRDSILRDSEAALNWLRARLTEVYANHANRLTEHRLNEVKTVGDLWKTLDENKTPAVTVSAISLRSGPNVPVFKFPNASDQHSWDVVDKALAYYWSVEGDRKEAFPRLIARVALKLGINQRDVVNMPIGEFVKALSDSAAPVSHAVNDPTTCAEKWLKLPRKQGGPTEPQSRFIRAIIDSGGWSSHKDIAFVGKFDWEDVRKGAVNMADRINKRLEGHEWEVIGENNSGCSIVLRVLDD